MSLYCSFPVLAHRQSQNNKKFSKIKKKSLSKLPDVNSWGDPPYKRWLAVAPLAAHQKVWVIWAHICVQLAIFIACEFHLPPSLWMSGCAGDTDTTPVTGLACTLRHTETLQVRLVKYSCGKNNQEKQAKPRKQKEFRTLLGVRKTRAHTVKQEQWPIVKWAWRRQEMIQLIKWSDFT